MDKKIVSSIKKSVSEASSILLHLHPSPDGDSVGSALALFWYLKSLNKKVTVIKGDSELPLYMSTLPGFDYIVPKNFFEVNLKNIDLFIAVDTAAINQISKKAEISFPKNLKTIVIDHHATNPAFGDINLIDTSSPATSQIIFELFQKLGVQITPQIALNLLIGIYTDTGGFKYSPTSFKTFDIVKKLSEIYPLFTQTIFEIENNNEPEYIHFKGLALSSVKTYFNNHIAISEISYKALKKHKIGAQYSEKAEISNMLKSVKNWLIGITLVEREPGVCTISLRTRNAALYNVADIATATGSGGGHSAAAGGRIEKPLVQARKTLLKIIQKLHPELGQP